MSIIDSSVEKIPLTIFKTKQEASLFVAKQIASFIHERNKQGKPTVLGLAAGNSPLLVYKELIRIHKEDKLSFENVITFNLDEYYPLSPNNKKSYRNFMYEHIFRHIDIKPENIHFPDGSIQPDEIENFCINYENEIALLGGIDIQILGISRSGRIGFNEPGASVSSITRLVQLHEITIEDASKDFGNEEYVPHNAITMGIKSILNAKSIYLMVWGESRADIVQKAIEGEVENSVPASFLQLHAQSQVILDSDAASQLSRFQTPWLTGVCDWTSEMKKKAVVWLCKQTQKPILKLTESDYKKWGLTDLLKTQGSAYNLNIDVHNQIQQTITGWPGGKPNSDDSVRPERSNPYPKRVLVFSPHPDDDVISMGGTLLRLVEQGHDVHVAYQTSGNIAVFDDEVRRFTDFALAFSKEFNLEQDSIQSLHQHIVDSLKTKTIESADFDKILKVKGLIRQGEASSACRFIGVKDSNIHFLNMPFYKTGSELKKELEDEDIKLITDLLTEIKPHQIFAAGDLKDPHGTHATCLQAIQKALVLLKDEQWINDCYVWLYRGAWQEWNIEEINMAVPISPEELLKKRKAIFKHQSQKDSPVFPGEDKREFWQRAEDRNRATAQLYDELGLTEYEAIEAFKRHMI